MKGRLKTIYDEIINTDLVSAKDFSRLYEAHLKALNKIEAMEAENKRLKLELKNSTQGRIY